MNLAAAIARVRMRISGYTSSSSSSSSSSSAIGIALRVEKGKGAVGGSKNLRNITVDDAMSEFHRLSSVVARKVRLFNLTANPSVWHYQRQNAFIM